MPTSRSPLASPVALQITPLPRQGLLYSAHLQALDCDRRSQALPPAQTPPQHPPTQNLTAPNEKKSTSNIPTASPRAPFDVRPRSSKSATQPLGRPHAFLARLPKVSHILIVQHWCDLLLTTAARVVSTRPSRPSFCCIPSLSPSFPRSVLCVQRKIQGPAAWVVSPRRTAGLCRF